MSPGASFLEGYQERPPTGSLPSVFSLNQYKICVLPSSVGGYSAFLPLVRELQKQERSFH
ncbi:hypothetical protein SLEP1_g60088 [Rubroshorea leprosula]|uniref:Uncharacterized protein n=1 Tax=Rubroshorea leprosula TaxID=152421 RepID=A0AAV5MWV0_9ROSI|nr:hypothetical protein SLEP1_g60088 [Rubroshorea leprosula]